MIDNNSIWIGIVVLLLMVLGASVFIHYRQHLHAVAMHAEIERLQTHSEVLERREQVRQEMEKLQWEHPVDVKDNDVLTL